MALVSNGFLLLLVRHLLLVAMHLFLVANIKNTSTVSNGFKKQRINEQELLQLQKLFPQNVFVAHFMEDGTLLITHVLPDTIPVRQYV